MLTVGSTRFASSIDMGGESQIEFCHCIVRRFDSIEDGNRNLESSHQWSVSCETLSSRTMGIETWDYAYFQRTPETPQSRIKCNLCLCRHSRNSHVPGLGKYLLVMGLMEVASCWCQSGLIVSGIEKRACCTRGILRVTYRVWSEVLSILVGWHVGENSCRKFCDRNCRIPNWETSIRRGYAEKGFDSMRLRDSICSKEVIHKFGKYPSFSKGMVTSAL